MSKYVFQSNNYQEELEKLDDMNNEVKFIENIEEACTSKDCEVSEYPIEFYENQQHAVERHIKNK